MPEVPSIDNEPSKEPENRSGVTSSVEDRLMLTELDRENAEKAYRQREFEQRHWLRYVAVFIIILAIFGMTIFICKLPIASHVALYIAPIVSISTLSIALLISAFRGWRDGDEKTGTSLASDALKATKLFP